VITKQDPPPAAANEIRTGKVRAHRAALSASTAIMSKATEHSSEDEIKAAMKSERLEKKEKREKKEKKRAKSEKSGVEIAPAASEEATGTPKKKRKREALPDEIEIDVGAPVPLSKQAARKLKKAKLNPASNDADATDGTKAPAEAGDDKPGQRSAFGAWIGNLPWSATKESLRAFLMDHAEIKSDHITRVHMPPPTKVNPTWTTKPLNKGFAYVDFATELAMYSAIALTETKMDGRALLIKNAKSFEGRPDKPKEEEQDSSRGNTAGKQAHPPNKRIFVGNLSFDVTQEDLEAHFGQCGPIETLQMATFEDSGKCKGYGWITFCDLEAAESAVKGFIIKTEAEIKGAKKKNADESEDEADVKHGQKKRKWLLNKLMGRDVRREFAEDATIRYNKRYGKAKEPEAIDGVDPGRWKNFSDSKPRQERHQPKVDPRSIRPGQAHTNAQRASQAIVEGKGRKTTF
jgi:RNA recognition motif-containing protein